MKCGGSDYTSGLASNPAVGRVADRLADLGGAVVLGEIAEIMGAEHLLADRASSPDTARHLLRIVSRVGAQAMAPARHPRHPAVTGQHPRRPDDDR